MTTRKHLPDLEATPHANVFPESEPKTVRLSLEAGERVDRHRHPGRDIVLYLLEGELTLHLAEDEHDVTEGDIVRFDGEQDISPVATEDSTALIVLAQRPEDD